MTASSVAAQPNATLTPPLKWAGGKRWLAKDICSAINEIRGSYYEPFLGSGAILFSLPRVGAVASDVNIELINFYTCIRDKLTSVMDKLYGHAARHNEKYYYEQRAFLPDDDVCRAARFIYLNRTCWNGLYRVNLKGEFNVPKGTKDVVIRPEEDFREISMSLRRVNLIVSDFEPVISKAKINDVVYCDPPYTVSHNNNGFIKYNERMFSWSDQKRLAESAFLASSRGARVFVSNAEHPSIRELYNKASEIRSITRYSVISGLRDGRQPTRELFIRV